MQNFETTLLNSYIINAIVLILMGVWPILSVVTLFRLRRLKLPGAQALVWALLIVFAPLIGVIAFFILTHEHPRTPNL